MTAPLTTRAAPMADDLHLAAWLSSCWALGTEVSATSEELYSRYAHWCPATGHLPATLRTFSLWLSAQGFKISRVPGHHRRKGIAITKPSPGGQDLRPFTVSIRGHLIVVMMPSGLDTETVLFRLRSLFGREVSLAPEKVSARG